jgi:hypothetical protein
MKILLAIIILFVSSFTLLSKELDELKRQQIVNNAIIQDAVIKTNKMVRCMAFSDHLTTISDQFIKENNKDPDVVKFVMATRHYSEIINKNLEKYYPIATKNLNEDEKIILDKIYGDMYRTEYNAILMSKKPTVKLAIAYKKLLDNCTIIDQII